MGGGGEGQGLGGHATPPPSYIILWTCFYTNNLKESIIARYFFDMRYIHKYKKHHTYKYLLASCENVCTPHILILRTCLILWTCFYMNNLKERIIARYFFKCAIYIIYKKKHHTYKYLWPSCDVFWLRCDK